MVSVRKALTLTQAWSSGHKWTLHLKGQPTPSWQLLIYICNVQRKPQSVIELRFTLCVYFVSCFTSGFSVNNLRPCKKYDYCRNTFQQYVKKCMKYDCSRTVTPGCLSWGTLNFITSCCARPGNCRPPDCISGFSGYADHFFAHVSNVTKKKELLHRQASIAFFLRV